jgi:hypothetical protein
MGFNLAFKGLIVSINFVVNIKTKCLNYFVFVSPLKNSVKKFPSFGLLTSVAVTPRYSRNLFINPIFENQNKLPFCNDVVFIVVT